MILLYIIGWFLAAKLTFKLWSAVSTTELLPPKYNHGPKDNEWELCIQGPAVYNSIFGEQIDKDMRHGWYSMKEATVVCLFFWPLLIGVVGANFVWKKLISVGQRIITGNPQGRLSK